MFFLTNKNEKQQTLGTFTIKNLPGDDIVYTATKIADGVVNFTDSISKVITQRRFLWEEGLMLKSCSNEQLNKMQELIKSELQNRNVKRHKISMQICNQLQIEYIDFSEPENFLKLLDLIFKYKKHFSLYMNKREKNYQEDVLNILLKEFEEVKIEQPLQIKEFACIIKNEYWSK